MDDWINTTTARSSGTTIRNDLTIDVNSLLAKVLVDAAEGDAIDSNGKLIINGGTIIATGNMVDQISNDSNQDFIYASFNKINADSLIVIKDEDNKIIIAFKTSRGIQTIFYSSSELKYDSYKIYVGEETNGLYTKINSYSGGEEITFNNQNNSIRNANNSNNISDTLLKA